MIERQKKRHSTMELYKKGEEGARVGETEGKEQRERERESKRENRPDRKTDRMTVSDRVGRERQTSPVPYTY